MALPALTSPGVDLVSRPTVTAVPSSVGPSYVVADRAVQDVRSVARAATKEQCRPGMNGSALRPRPWTRKFSGSGPVEASERSRLPTTTPSTIRLSAAHGSRVEVSRVRGRRGFGRP